MSRAIPPILPPFSASSGNPSNPNANMVDMMPTTIDPINTTIIGNVAQSVVDENLPQLLDLRGVSHVTNVPAFDKEDFTKYGPFVPMSSLSTSENPLPKRQNQWSNAEIRLANQDKRLKSIIISCLPNDVMKSVIKYKTNKEIWNDIILAYEGPSDTRDTKIAALRLKFNAFKSLEGEKPEKKMAEHESNSEGISYFLDGPNLENTVKDFYSKNIPRLMQEDQRKNMVNKYNLFKQELSLHKSELSNLKNIVFINYSLHNEVIRVNLENESLKDEISDLKRVIEKWTCSKVTLDKLLSKQIPGNIVKAFGGKGRRKENNPSKEVLFTKVDVSTSESAPIITFDSKDDSDIQEHLPPLPKLTMTNPSNDSKSLISLSDLTVNKADLTLNTASKEIKKPNKVSQTYVIKKKT
nr:hypothetical protein [Tanacetum cinerariifolium]